MSVAKLIELKNAIDANAVISAFIAEKFDKPLKHRFSYLPFSGNHGDYPCFTYLKPLTELKSDKVYFNAQGLIVIQITDKSIDKTNGNKIENGIVLIDNLAEMLADYLMQSPLIDIVFTDITLGNDMGLNQLNESEYPFYEGGIKFTMKGRRTKRGF